MRGALPVCRDPLLLLPLTSKPCTRPPGEGALTLCPKEGLRRCSVDEVTRGERARSNEVTRGGVQTKLVSAIGELAAELENGEHWSCLGRDGQGTGLPSVGFTAALSMDALT